MGSTSMYHEVMYNTDGCCITVLHISTETIPEPGGKKSVTAINWADGVIYDMAVVSPPAAQTTRHRFCVKCLPDGRKLHPTYSPSSDIPTGLTSLCSPCLAVSSDHRLSPLA